MSALAPRDDVPSIGAHIGPMQTDPRLSKPLEHSQVALGERWQIGYWTTAMRCTEGELRNAVAAVGTSIGDVRRYLASRA